MKKISLLLFLFILSSESTFALTLLKPSLMAQMQYQEKINFVNFASERRLKNQLRLAEIRSQRQADLRAKNAPKTPLITEKNTTPPIPKVTPIVTGSTEKIVSLGGTNVDMSRVRDTWFSWYNTYRQSLGLSNYNYDARLDITAHEWNIEFAKGKGDNHHRRNTGDAYYDFPVIDAWFMARGINPIVINRSKNTENVGYGYYSCSSSDCTDELIASIRSTYNFFMSEKGKSYDAHYRSIINPYFTKMGFDIIVVPSERRYYITVHYITE